MHLTAVIHNQAPKLKAKNASMYLICILQVDHSLHAIIPT